jgi:hypothetical protein
MGRGHFERPRRRWEEVTLRDLGVDGRGHFERLRRKWEEVTLRNLGVDGKRSL